MTDKPSAVSYICAGIVGLIGTVTLEAVAVVVGIVTAIGTFAVNWYYKRKHDKREQARLKLEQARLEAIQDEHRGNSV